MGINIGGGKGGGFFPDPQLREDLNGVTERLTDIAINIDLLGADKTGVNDSYNAFFEAINSFPNAESFTIMLSSGVYKISKPLYITRGIMLKGKGKSKTIIDFSGATEKANAPYHSFLTVVHSNNIIGGSGSSPNPIILPSGQIGIDGRDSVLEDFTIIGNPDATDEQNGIVINAPCELNRVESNNHSGYGIMILANTIKDGLNIKGIANHTKLKQTSTSGNKKDGTITWGNDANTFVIDNATSYSNGGWGFYDKSLLGGVLIGTEADSNLVGGYGGDYTTPSRTAYIGTYCEGNQPIFYQLSQRALIIGSTGVQPEAGQSYIGTVTQKGIVNYKPINIADSDQLAYDLGGTTGNASRLSKDRLDIRTRIGKDTLTLTQDTVSVNYASILLGSSRSIAFPYDNVTNAIPKGRPYFPNGFALDTNTSIEVGSAIPTTGTYNKGQIILNTAPNAGGYLGWVCVTGGTSGTWKGFGLIEA
jgi:hypothetical protein